MVDFQNCHVWLPGGKAGKAMSMGVVMEGHENKKLVMQRRKTRGSHWWHQHQQMQGRQPGEPEKSVTCGTQILDPFHQSESLSPPSPWLPWLPWPGTIRRDCCWTLQVPAQFTVWWSSCHVFFRCLFFTMKSPPFDDQIPIFCCQIHVLDYFWSWHCAFPNFDG